MKINGNAIRPGNIIEYNGGLWVAVKTQHTQPGKGGAYLQVELKNIRDGRKDNVRFRSSETVEQVRMEEKTFQFLFGQDDEFNFMDHETFEQIAVNQDMVGEQSVYLVEGMPVTVSMYEGEIISITLPAKVTVTIREADAVVKGQTASGSYKPAILDNGVRVMVPPYIESGERIVVDTSDNTFVERAKD